MSATLTERKYYYIHDSKIGVTFAYDVVGHGNEYTVLGAGAFACKPGYSRNPELMRRVDQFSRKIGRSIANGRLDELMPTTGVIGTETIEALSKPGKIVFMAKVKGCESAKDARHKAGQAVLTALDQIKSEHPDYDYRNVLRGAQIENKFILSRIIQSLGAK